MKSFKKFFSKKAVLSLALVAAIVGVGGVSVAQFGPSRPTKAYHQGVAGFDHVTFNSFTGVPNIGDERNFVTGKIAGAPDGFYDPMNQVRDGNEILVRVYVHNNADTSTNASGKGVAKNTKVRAEVPTNLSQAQQIKGYVSADNAEPKQIYDTLDINANYPFQFDYVEGSATIKTNKMDRAVSDEIVNGGVLIGDDALDGQMPGCFEYVALVTFKVKIEAPNYVVEKTVRKEGETRDQWRESADVKPGDTVEWRLNFKNTGATKLDKVAMFDKLPAGTNFVPGSTMIYNATTPNGVSAGTDAVKANGIDVGNYFPNANAIVVFKTKIASSEELECGVTTLVNNGYAKPGTQGVVTDTAKVVVDNSEKECDEKPNPSYACDLLKAEIGEGRKTKFTASATAINGAVIKRYIYNFGDGTQELTTDKSVVEHTYATAGNYVARVKVEVEVNGETKVAESGTCATSVNFTTPPETPKTPGTPGSPSSLPNTGPGAVVATFLAVTSLSTAAYYAIVRKFAGL